MMATVKGLMAAMIFFLNTVLSVSVLMVFALLKLLIPMAKVRQFLSKILVAIAEFWVSVNSRFHRLLHGEKMIVTDCPKLSQQQWYLVVANHQSMVDIPLLQAMFNKKIPFLKFFLKQQLIWVPFLGLAWWALDFPFMKRYSRSKIDKNPELKGKDMERTKKSCERFKQFPTSVINFVEGTRFSEQKRTSQQSPYRHLLKPKAGGLGFVMGSMGEQIKQMLLVSINYQGCPPKFWDYLCGRFNRVQIACHQIDLPEELLNKNYQTDSDFRQALFNWCERLWQQQDEILATMKKGQRQDQEE